MATRGKDEGSSSGQFPRRRIYACKHCQHYFFSPQALGGHQNAHRPRPRQHPVFVQAAPPPPVPAQPLPPPVPVPPVYAPLPVLVQAAPLPPVPAPWAEGTGDNFSQQVHNLWPIGAQGYGIQNWGMIIPNAELADDEASSTTGEEYSDLDLELRL